MLIRSEQGVDSVGNIHINSLKWLGLNSGTGIGTSAPQWVGSF